MLIKSKIFGGIIEACDYEQKRRFGFVSMRISRGRKEKEDGIFGYRTKKISSRFC